MTDPRPPVGPAEERLNMGSWFKEPDVPKTPTNEAELLEYYGLPPDGDLSEIMGC